MLRTWQHAQGGRTGAAAPFCHAKVNVVTTGNLGVSVSCPLKKQDFQPWGVGRPQCGSTSAVGAQGCAERCQEHICHTGSWL